MFKVVGLQCGVAVLFSLIAAGVFGATGAWSAALGGAVCVIPSGLFALRLQAAKGQAGGAYALAFFVGEIFKLALCIGLLVAIRVTCPGLHWGAFLMGLIATYQANLFAFLIKN